MQSLTEFIKKELIFYIKQEYEKGNSLANIKEALLEGGHHKDLVKEAIDSLKKYNFNIVKALEDPIKKNLDKELYYDIVNSLVRYIEFHLKKGHKPETIKKTLADYGHTNEMIDNAMQVAARNIIHTPWYVKLLEFGFIIIILITIAFISGSTGDPIEVILFSFSPVLFTIVATYIALRTKIDFSYLWIAPITLTGLFALFTILSPVTVRGMETLKISTLNLALSMLFVYIKVMQSFNQDKAIISLAREVQTKADIEKKD